MKTGHESNYCNARKNKIEAAAIRIQISQNSTKYKFVHY